MTKTADSLLLAKNTLEHVHGILVEEGLREQSKPEVQVSRELHTLQIGIISDAPIVTADVKAGGVYDYITNSRAHEWALFLQALRF